MSFVLLHGCEARSCRVLLRQRGGSVWCVELTDASALAELLRADEEADCVVKHGHVGADLPPLQFVLPHAGPRAILVTVGSSRPSTRDLWRFAAPAAANAGSADTLGHALLASRSGAEPLRLLASVRRTGVIVVFDNDPGLVPSAIGAMSALLARLDPAEDQRALVSLAVREALLNALFHGNLGLDSSLRLESERTFLDLAARRRTIAPYRNRLVRLEAGLDTEWLTVTITDEGEGFDHAARQRDDVQPEHPTGRGLLLIRSFVDSVAFNEHGNRIVLRHRLDRTPPPGDPGGFRPARQETA